MVRTRLGDNERHANSLRKNKTPMQQPSGYMYDIDGASSGVFDHQMELDDPHDLGSTTNGTGGGMAMSGILTESDSNGHTVTDEDLLMYGQELRNEFKGPAHAARKNELDSILGLMAYENPRNSTLGHLLEEEGRVGLAEELNKAILGKSLS
jgi:hypothetical protein